jgi:uncharacterized protein
MAKEKTGTVTTDSNTMGILAHILGFFTSFIGPLIIYLAVADAKTKEYSKEALNWQISLLIYIIVSGILAMVLIGFLLLGALGIMNIIFCILAAVKASQGEVYKYPLTIRLVK